MDDFTSQGLITGLLAAVFAVVSVPTPEGELQLALRDGQVRASLAGQALPQEAVTTEGRKVTVTRPGGGHLAVVDFQPEPRNYPAVFERRRLRIGVDLKELDEAVAAQIDAEPRSAVVVVDVTEGLPAQRAGLARYDVIVEMNGTPPATQARLTELLENAKEGEALALTVLRKGRRHRICVTPEATADVNLQFELSGADRFSSVWQGLTRASQMDLFRGATATNLDLALSRRLLADAALKPAVTDPPAEAQIKDLKTQLDEVRTALGRIQELLDTLDRRTR